MRFLPLSVLLGLLPAVIIAQTAPPSPPAAKDLLGSAGGFESASNSDNLWDGVDADGILVGFRETVEALSERSVSNMAMPVSVAAADMNGDGLIDIVTADAKGYLRCYFNSGTRGEAKFTHAEIIPIYFAREDRRKASRISLFDWAGRGAPDLIAGNYVGELFFIQNSGGPQRASFVQPASVPKATTPTSKTNALWANLLSPAAWDFNNDGRVDAIVGEGSYSANAVHLLLNKGSNARPVFSEESRFYLAYGDGREHLTPTVADFNGDGFPDVLASNRGGTVGVYLNPGASWKPGQEFKWKQDITFGSATTLGGLCTICAADMNGDGLFDLLIGNTQGRVLMAFNRGTKTEPKFDPPAPVKGVDLWGRTLHSPSGWQVDPGTDRGNAYITVSCVKATEDANAVPPEGQQCLWVGYSPSPNKFFGIPNLLLPYLKGDDTPGSEGKPKYFAGSPEFDGAQAPTNTVIIRRALPKVKQGGNYSLTFKIKGVGITKATWAVAWTGYKKLGDEKVERQERGEKVTRFEAREEGSTTGTFTASTAWSEVSRPVKIEKFKSKDLQDIPELTAVLEFRVTLTPNTGSLYLDEVRLTEK
ncbi:MAG TPA: VCBS repeat-containing protein [Chthoniobacterales bacterium]